MVQNIGAVDVVGRLRGVETIGVERTQEEMEVVEMPGQIKVVGAVKRVGEMDGSMGKRVAGVKH